MSHQTAVDMAHHVTIADEERWARELSHDAVAAYQAVEAARLHIATVNLIDSFGASAAKYLVKQYGEPLLHRVLSQRHALIGQNGEPDSTKALPKLDLAKLEIHDRHMPRIRTLIAEAQAERDAKAGLVDDVATQVRPVLGEYTNAVANKESRFGGDSGVPLRHQVKRDFGI